MSAFDDLPPDPQADVAAADAATKARMAMMPNCGVSPWAWLTLPDRSWQGPDRRALLTEWIAGVKGRGVRRAA